MTDSLPTEPQTPPEKDPSQFWGYRAKDLRRSGLGHLVPPGVPDDARTANIGGISRLDYTLWSTDPKEAPAPTAPAKPVPEQPQPAVEVIDPPQKRKPGGQPGNRNALKHGLYLDQMRLRNTTPIEAAILFDISEMIEHIKEYIIFTYETGIKAKSIAEVNETMRSLSLAGMSLTRLIHTHSQHITTYLPESVTEQEASSVFALIKHYEKKVGSMEFSNLDFRADQG